MAGVFLDYIRAFNAFAWLVMVRWSNWADRSEGLIMRQLCCYFHVLLINLIGLAIENRKPYQTAFRIRPDLARYLLARGLVHVVPTPQGRD